MRPWHSHGGVVLAPRSPAAQASNSAEPGDGSLDGSIDSPDGGLRPLIPLTLSHVFRSITLIACCVVPDKSNYSIIGYERAFEAPSIKLQNKATLLRMQVFPFCYNPHSV